MIKKILYVEDNPDNQFLIKYYLKQEPYELQFADNGHSAVEKVNTDEYDLFMVDLSLPDGISGQDVIREIRSNETNKDKPVFVVTAFTRHDRDEMEFNVAVDEYLTKPIKKDFLISLLGKFLG